MASAGPYNERAARKQFVRRRQRLVFSIILLVLAAILVLAIMVFLGHMDGTGKQSAKSQPNYGVAVPCAPAKATVMDFGQISVRVLNGTKYSGLATAIKETLVNRGFKVTDVGSTPSKEWLERTQIHFGAKGVIQAYTVNAQFSDAIMVMDDRKDALVDVMIGQSFENLNSVNVASSKPGATIHSFDGCVADAGTMKNLPKAPAH